MSNIEGNELLAHHILTEIRRFDSKFDRLDERMSKYNETLVRNTISLEDHVSRTNLLQSRVLHVESEVTGLKEHINKVKVIFSFFSFLFTDNGRMIIKILIPLLSAILSYLFIDKAQVVQFFDWVTK